MEEPRNSKTPLIIGGVVAALVLVGGVLWAASQASKAKETTASPSPSSHQAAEKSTEAAASPSPASGEVAGEAAAPMVVDVEAGSFYFKPNEIRAKVGQKVTVNLKAVTMMHDFYIDELNVKSPVVVSGNTGTVEFTPAKAGTFEFYCSVGNHRAQGQVGKLIVTE